MVLGVAVIDSELWRPASETSEDEELPLAAAAPTSPIGAEWS